MYVSNVTCRGAYFFEIFLFIVSNSMLPYAKDNGMKDDACDAFFMGEHVSCVKILHCDVQMKSFFSWLRAVY